jgi:hypothetical protein
LAAEIIGELLSPKGKIVQVKWDHDTKEVFMGNTNWYLVGEADSAEQAIKKVEFELTMLAKGRISLGRDQIPLEFLEIPKLNNKIDEDELPPVPLDVAIAAQEILERNKNRSKESEKLKKPVIAEVHYSESFISQGLKVLREMAEKNISQMPYGEPFNNFSVVIGATDKTIVAVLDVPDDLKEKIGNKAYIVQE